jgi:hypothetical protein
VTRPLRIQPLADEDAQQDYEWYEEQGAGLGDALLDNLQICLERIESSPFEFPIIAGDARRALVRRFPYRAYGCRGAQCRRAF